jgi:hypothetical protein
MTNTTAPPADISELEDLKSQIDESINQGTATPEIKTLIDEMIGKSREVLDETNNLAYLPYYEFAVNALAILPELDTTPPEIIIITPINGTSYILNQSVPANWQAIDLGSGISSVTATVPNGTAIDISKIGTMKFTVDATDNAGNEASKTAIYNVVYNYSGILPPIKDSKDAFKLGSTIPVKFQLRDASGNNISTAIARIYLAKFINGITGKEINGTSTSKSTTDNLFRYDAADNQYIFNLDTKPLTGGTWQIRIELDDDTSKYVTVSLK